VIDASVQPGVQLASGSSVTNSTRFTHALDHAWVHRLTWLVFPLTIVFAITRQSLWTDEGFTVWFASHRSLATFFFALIGSPGAPGDPQLIFYLLYMWGWIKAFGTGEVALRAANIPFAILFIGTMAWASRNLLRRPSLWLYFCLSPFFWFYLNEARPYVALLAFSSVASVALLAYLLNPLEYKVLGPWCSLVALFLALGTHIMAVFLLPTLLALVVLTMLGDPPRGRSFLKDWRRPALLCLPAFVALGAFYLWASSYGVSKGYGKPTLSSLAFVVYEFAGFSGLGPPRNDLRNSPELSVFVPYWPFLLLGFIALLGAAFFLFSSRPPKIVISLAASLLVGVAVALIISRIQDVRILGRHLAALFPLFLITPMFWLEHSYNSRLARYGAIAASIVIAGTWWISDARLVLLQKYQKDSYRAAAFTAIARVRSDHGKILWAADPHTAHYYGIQVRKGSQSAEIGNDDGMEWPASVQAVDAVNWTPEEARAYLDTTATPTILVLGKADSFDRNAAWRAQIQPSESTGIARLSAFSIYEWQPKRVTPQP